MAAIHLDRVELMDEEIVETEALVIMEEATGTIQCNSCDYWGEMTGFIHPDNPKSIDFVCPECSVVERVINPFA